MSKRRVSIKDIAEVADVSYSTVSRALDGSSRISEETRSRVQRIAEEMGYTPSTVAKSLQSNRTNTIGLVVTSLDDPFFSKIVKGVEEVASRANLSVFLSVSYDDPNKEMEAIETFDRRRVDGILMASSRTGKSFVDRLARIDVPVVLLQNEAEGGHDFLHSVIADDLMGAKLAVSHLLKLGHRRIGYIGVSDRQRSNRLRMRGYREAMNDADISVREEWVEVASKNELNEHGDVEMGRILGRKLYNTDTTAIFCYNDMVAVGVTGVMNSLGIDIPDTCSVIGFDNVNITEYVTPKLTTIDIPKYEMGKNGMRTLLGLINTGEGGGDKMVEPTLVKRESTASVPE